MSVVEILLLLTLAALVSIALWKGAHSVVLSWHRWRGIRALTHTNKLYVLRLRLGVVTLTLAKDDLGDRLEAFRVTAGQLADNLDPLNSLRRHDGQ